MKNPDEILILIVDDQPEYLQTINRFFSESKLPYKIINSPNGKVALQIIEKKLPDLIITDWEIPVMDGIEFIKILKEDKRTSDIPVIMCTGVMTSSENLETALEAGAVDYIRKPIDKLELIARTKANLHLAESYKKIKKQKEEIELQRDDILNKNMELDILNYTKDRFFSIIAHDLRSPFNAILGFSDLLQTKCYNCRFPENTNMINILHKSATNTFALLENLLLWSQSQMGGIEFNPQNHPLKPVVIDIFSLLEESAKNKEIKLQHSIDDKDTGFFDYQMIHTVLRNLVSNAIKFTGLNGVITVNIRLLDKFVEVSVIDNGVGIEQEKINNLFRIDTQVSTKGTANEKGTGLGLIICKEFVKTNGGNIWVKSEPGKGSQFIFTIPIG